MTENDYIKATNRVKMSLVCEILRDIIAGDDLGISEEELRSIKLLTYNAQDKLFNSYTLEPTNAVECKAIEKAK